MALTRTRRIQSTPVLRSMVWGATATWHLVTVSVLGVWLLAAPTVFGVAIVALSLPRGRITETYDTWDGFIR